MRPEQIVVPYIIGVVITCAFSIASFESPRVSVGRAVVWPLALAVEVVRCVWVWGRECVRGWRDE